MLDGRVLGASQVEYKPFGKPPLKREPLHTSWSQTTADKDLVAAPDTKNPRCTSMRALEDPISALGSTQIKKQACTLLHKRGNTGKIVAARNASIALKIFPPNWHSCATKRAGRKRKQRSSEKSAIEPINPKTPPRKGLEPKGLCWPCVGRIARDAARSCACCSTVTRSDRLTGSATPIVQNRRIVTDDDTLLRVQV